ncbi:MAG: hypothetical protein ABI602_03170 [Candidatus Saccharibacteria bacterium]
MKATKQPGRILKTIRQLQSADDNYGRTYAGNFEQIALAVVIMVVAALYQGFPAYARLDVLVLGLLFILSIVFEKYLNRWLTLVFLMALLVFGGWVYWLTK